MTSLRTHAGADADADGGPVMRSGSPWLGMLRQCLVYCGWVIIPLSIAAAVVSGWPGLGSSLFAAVVVVAFSSITLLIGHSAGPEKPMQAMGLFIAAYAFKVVGFGALLLIPGRPDWLVGGWFLAAALGAVLAWQAAELRVFASSRQLLYADDGLGLRTTAEDVTGNHGSKS